MAYTNNNVPLLNRKEWQMMTPAPTASVAAAFVVTDPTGEQPYALYVASATVHYLYNHDNDGWIAIPSSGIAGAFAAGSCGTHHPFGPSATATAGTTTTVTTNLTLYGTVIGRKIRITGGTNAGEERTISAVVPGANSVITVSVPFSNPIDNTSVYQLITGKFYFFNAGTAAVGFRSFDIATMAWSGALSVTNLPTAFATDGKLVSTGGYRTYDLPFATGTATSGSTTTIVNSAKAWATNQWTNYQVRITAGTGVGKTAVITTNNGTTLNFANIGATLDNTSQYIIEGDDNKLYLLGNGAATIYIYSISGNSWTATTPSPARAGVPSTGFSANWVARVVDSKWNTENAIRNGRYIYSFRGGASATLDIYDITTGGWANLPYGGQMATFTTGSGFDQSGNYYYCRQNATNNFYRYDFANNFITGYNQNLYTDSTALLGDKVWTKKLPGSTDVEWLYSLQNTGTALHRLMLY